MLGVPFILTSFRKAKWYYVGTLGDKRHHQSYPAVKLMTYNANPSDKVCPHLWNNSTITEVTNCPLIISKPTLQEGTHAWCCKLSQNPMIQCGEMAQLKAFTMLVEDKNSVPSSQIKLNAAPGKLRFQIILVPTFMCKFSHTGIHINAKLKYFLMTLKFLKCLGRSQDQ